MIVICLDPDALPLQRTCVTAFKKTNKKKTSHSSLSWHLARYVFTLNTNAAKIKCIYLFNKKASTACIESAVYVTKSL